MRYVSTRGQAPELGFMDVVLAGLAEDGGLYVPAEWPALDIDALRGKSYQEVAFAVMQPFVAPDIPDADLRALIDKSYAPFRHPDVVPVKPLLPPAPETSETSETSKTPQTSPQTSPAIHLMELFHGPTLAFKDVALQFLGHLFEYILERRDQHITVLGATSGDTGSAAIEGCRGQDRIQIFILHPHERVSEVQRRQMTTLCDDNVHNLAVKGTFDDCQAIVKEAFGDLKFRRTVNLSAINSINWARIMAQVVYYVSAALQFDQPATFSVPTGNFGNIFAGFVAQKMGAPIAHLIAATNKNDILYRYFETGSMEVEGVDPSHAPSMDIQVSSNFERLLFEMTGRNANGTASQMELFKTTGTFHYPREALQGFFSASRLDDPGILAEIKAVYEKTGELIDPHTATGVFAARQYATTEAASGPIVALACAHPAKFPDAVQAASGQHPALPDFLADLFEREERLGIIDNDVEAIKASIAQIAKTT